MQTLEDKMMLNYENNLKVFQHYMPQVYTKTS